jgi:chaperonin GroEL (HSP60 family)
MEFQNGKKDVNELNFIQKQFETDPCINVICKKDFEERVEKIFTILWQKLANSFGPGGAGTFISIYPNYYSTKDGFTIMKNIAFDKKLDQVISDMVMTVCNRLNFTVGDGTTTAVIATKSVYKVYHEKKEFFEKHDILPRDILKRMEYFKDIILKALDEAAIPIRSNNPKELRKNIEKVVYVSSNGNQELTTMIGELYEQLMYPAISVSLSPSGEMKSSIVEGYKMDICLTDKEYINNDNETMLLNGSDVIMFDHKVMKETYVKILKPLSEACRERGRHLICIAPFYDENALSGIIKTDLNNEYRKIHDINLVLMCCSKATGHSKVLLEDLSMLLNTVMISPQTENEIIEILNNEGGNIYRIFDIDAREIDGTTIACIKNIEQNTLELKTYSSTSEEKSVPLNMLIQDKSIRVGYCDRAELGLKVSLFSGFYYDQETYDKYVSVAKTELAEIQKKCEKIGTFSLELNQKQQRVYALGLKNGLIEVGSSSELSQGYLKDSVDDAVKAAASAYNNGTILGCNVSLLRVIKNILSSSDDDMDETDYFILYLIYNGFYEVYKTVLSNVYENELVYADDKKVMYHGLDLTEDRDKHFKEEHAKEKWYKNEDTLSPNFAYVYVDSIGNMDDKYRVEDGTLYVSKEVIKAYYPGDTIAVHKYSKEKDSFPTAEFVKLKDHCTTAYDLIIQHSVNNDVVLNLETMKFSSDIINSTETDKEILKATIDLLSLLITGNQLVLC